MGEPSAWQPGQLLFVGFEGDELPPELGQWIEQGRIGGVILFTRNLRDPHQVRRLVRSIRQRAPEGTPVTIAIDQEGGRVQRLQDPWTRWPPMRRLGELAETSITAEFAAALAVQLTEVGVGLNFAPVVDVDTNPDNPIIGDRSFGRTPRVVGDHASVFIDRMQSLGIACCAKHFPGHGDTIVDSHLALPKLPHDLDRLRGVELPPFAAAIEAGVASIMSAHVIFEAIDRKRPATMSPDVMAILRHELGYDGLVFSDDLEMKAIADHYRPEQVVQGALEAGIDALLVCRQLGLVREVLGRLERSPDALVERAIERMIAFKARFPPPPLPAEDVARPPYPDHDELAARIRDGRW